MCQDGSIWRYLVGESSSSTSGSVPHLGEDEGSFDFVEKMLVVPSPLSSVPGSPSTNACSSLTSLDRVLSCSVIETVRPALGVGAPLDGADHVALVEDAAYGIAKIQAFRANKRRYLVIADNANRLSIVSEDGVV